jgi:hypothetical protein
MNKLKVLQKYNRLWEEAAQQQRKLGEYNNDKQDRYAMVINTLLYGGSLWHLYDYYVCRLRECDQVYRQPVRGIKTYYRKILAVIAEALVDLAEWRQGAVLSLIGYGFEAFTDRLKRKQRFLVSDRQSREEM